MSAKVQVKHRGPLVLEGDFKLVDANGHELPLPGPRCALCRCGASRSAPFCDGSHYRTNFGADAKVSPGLSEPSEPVEDGPTER